MYLAASFLFPKLLAVFELQKKENKKKQVLGDVVCGHMAVNKCSFIGKMAEVLPLGDGTLNNLTPYHPVPLPRIPTSEQSKIRWSGSLTANGFPPMFTTDWGHSRYWICSWKDGPKVQKIKCGKPENLKFRKILEWLYKCPSAFSQPNQLSEHLFHGIQLTGNICFRRWVLNPHFHSIKLAVFNFSLFPAC